MNITVNPRAVGGLRGVLAFDGDLLPQGIHKVSHAEFARMFVLQFHESTTRADIYEGYRRFHSAIMELGVATGAWLNGSFVTGKENPRDLDLVFFVDAGKYNGLTAEQKKQFANLVGPKGKERYHCDAYPVMVYSETTGDKFQLYKGSLAEWTRQFRKVRWRKGAQKGFIEVDLKEDHPPALEDLSARGEQ